MNTELFPAEAVTMESPRLRWMKRHEVKTWHSKHREDGPVWYAAFDDHDFDHEDTADFFFQLLGMHGSTKCGEGPTEDDALAALARKAGIRLWNEEDV